jgi:hypothetical protein
MGMMTVSAQQKRIISYMFAGLLPITLIYGALLFNLGVFFSFGIGIIVAFIGMILVHIVTVNALTNYELGGNPMLVTSDSLGVLNFYSVVVSPQDRVASAKVDGKDVNAAYSASSIFETIFRKEKVPAWSDQTHMHLLIPKEDAYTHTFSGRGTPTFLYNRRGSWFWTKSKFSGVEDGMILENTVSYLTYTTRNFEEYTRNYARSAIDKLWSKFNTPNLWLLLIVGGLILVLVLYGGDIANYFNQFISGGGEAVAKTGAALPPTEATQALPPS